MLERSSTQSVKTGLSGKCQTCNHITQVSIETAGSAPPDLQIQVGVITNGIKIAQFPDNEI